MMERIILQLLISSALLFLGHKTMSQQWIPLAYEDNLSPGNVYTLFADDTVLYVAGYFGTAGTINAHHIARWNSSDWDSLSGGILSGNIRCIQKYNGKIFAGGGFPSNGHPFSKKIDSWDGVDWIGVPNSYGDITGTVFAFTIYNNMLIVGGHYNSIGPYPFNFTKISAYDGNDYVHVGFLPDQVHALTVYNGELYAGGYFPTMKRFDGTDWQDVGGYFNYYIKDFEVDTFNNFLYAGGGFFVADDTLLTDGVAMWDGFKWNRVGYGYPSWASINGIELYHGDLYAGMGWDTIGGIFTGYFARWDGQNWYPAGDTVRWGVNDLEIFKDTLYVGGDDYYYPTPEKGMLGRWYMPPDTNCKYLQPRVFSLADNYPLNLGTVQVQFYNNNAYADSWAWDFGDGGIASIKDPLHDYTDTGTYNVTVTVTHQGCVKMASKTITIQDLSGVPDYSKESLGFKLYPNPTSGDVTVELNVPAKVEAELRSYSMYGNQLGLYALQTGYNKVLIPASKWSPGTALVVLYIDGKQVVVEKVVKVGNK